ncbi:MAG: PhoPQ-activated pathogenicity protein [Planctomycetota bacterium]|nr:MAG: PhoPQ-activated pathogenicity protein [Planctomycetota bacterium]
MIGRAMILAAMVLLLVGRVGVAAEAAAEGPLLKYVKKADASYKWTKRREGEILGAKYVELTLTSQTWRDVVWQHQLFVLRPASVPDDAKHAMLFITGGAWKPELAGPAGDRDKLPKEAPIFVALAEQLKTPVAILLQVPHQPILGGRYEDDAIAETFVNFMKTGDTEWPLLLPMVKSAVRGMDATQEFAAKQWKLNLKEFTITGASKRGWTTWLTGAVDPRAVAIAPMVIDMLNTNAQMRHQIESFGGPSEQIRDYSERGLLKMLDSERGKLLNLITDPYSYRKQLTQPKLLLLGTNDRYWPLDALNLYWDALEGEKYIVYVPNAGHGLNPKGGPIDVARVSGGLAAIHRRVVENATLPKLNWKLDSSDDGLALAVESNVAPKNVRVWMAKSKTKDFRDSQWTSRIVRRDGDKYAHELDMPSEGYAAMFGEAEYQGPSAPFFLSTNVRIIGNGKTATGGGGK